MNEQDDTFYSRERRKSRYLSYPYTNSGPGHKGFPVKTENSETPIHSHRVRHPRVANNHSNRSSTAATKSSKKKLRSKWCRKHIRWSTMSSSQEFRNVSSSELLSGLYSNALDCNFSSKNRKSDLIEWFFSAYRLSTFRDEAELAAILENQKNGNVGTPIRNGSLNVNSSKPEKKKSEQMRKCRNKSLPSQSDMNKDIAASEFVSGYSVKINNTMPGESMEDLKPVIQQQNVSSTTREGSSRAKRSLAPKASRAKKTKKTEVSLDPRNKFFQNLLDGSEKCDKSSSFVIDLQMMPSSISEKHYASQLGTVGNLDNGCSPMNASQLGGVGNLDNGFSPMNASQLGGVGNLDNGFFSMNASQFGGVGNLDNGFSPMNAAPAEHLKTKRATVIPDLNDGGFEDNLTQKKVEGDNGFSPDLKSSKHNQRMNQEPKSEPSRSISSGMDFIQTVNYNRMEVNGSCLLLNFNPGVSLPPKDDLLATFCHFGPLDVPETQMSKDGHAQIAFLKSADAEEAFRNLKQIKHFGATLIDHNDPSETFAPLKQCETIAGNSRSGSGSGSGSKLSDHCGRPSLDCIKQNLEMMASILEKRGHTISPQMRDKLEGEIKNLMEKVNSIGSLPVKD